MTLDDLQVLVQDQASFRKAFRKTDADSRDGDSAKNEMITLLSGNFGIGRMPSIHQVVLPNGSQIRLKFFNVVKEILSSKGKPVPGKESFLSYLEVTVMPAGIKGYTFTVDVNQIVWSTSKSKAQIKHDEKLAKLKAQADELGIDLSLPTAWTTVYCENY